MTRLTEHPQVREAFVHFWMTRSGRESEAERELLAAVVSALAETETGLYTESLIVALNPHNPVCLSGCDTCRMFTDLDRQHRAICGALREELARVEREAASLREALGARYTLDEVFSYLVRYYGHNEALTRDPEVREELAGNLRGAALGRANG